MLHLPIAWAGPYSPRKVITQFNDCGVPPGYDGEDYGLYQIYGHHILGDRNALLYVGEATDQTFAARLRNHQSWLAHEWPVRVYLGRLYVPRRHTPQANWERWKCDVLLAERILIYKYSPHYNSHSIGDPPKLGGFRKVVLRHTGARNRLRRLDVAPNDWH